MSLKGRGVRVGVMGFLDCLDADFTDSTDFSKVGQSVGDVLGLRAGRWDPSFEWDAGARG